MTGAALHWQTFDAIYLINLPERVDRRRELLSELRSVGLSDDDGRLIWVAAVRPAEAGEFPSIGSRGCFLSHLECLKSARARGFRRILILEDDAHFTRVREPVFAETLLALQNTSWSVWYGGYHLHEGEAAQDVRHGLQAISPATGIRTSHCVAFQADAIDSALAFLQLILTRPAGHPEAGPMHIDGAYSTWRALNPGATTLIAVPPLCLQRASRSDIAGRRWFDHAPLIRHGVDLLRRFRNRI
jgi:glycosyl transferase family 25